MKKRLLLLGVMILCALILSCQKKKTEENVNKEQLKQAVAKKDFSVIHFDRNDVATFIKTNPSINEIVAKYDAEIMKLPNKDDSFAIEKIKEKAKNEIKEYLASQKIDFDVYAAKSEKIIRVFMGEKIKSEPDILETKRKQLELIEKDPAKREEMLKAMAEAMKNLEKTYLQGATEEELSIIKTNTKQLEILMKNRQIKM